MQGEKENNRCGKCKRQRNKRSCNKVRRRNFDDNEDNEYIVEYSGDCENFHYNVIDVKPKIEVLGGGQSSVPTEQEIICANVLNTPIQTSFQTSVTQGADFNIDFITEIPYVSLEFKQNCAKMIAKLPLTLPPSAGIPSSIPQNTVLSIQFSPDTEQIQELLARIRNFDYARNFNAGVGTYTYRSNNVGGDIYWNTVLVSLRPLQINRDKIVFSLITDQILPNLRPLIPRGELVFTYYF